MRWVAFLVGRGRSLSRPFLEPRTYIGHAPDLGTYVSLEYLQDGIGLPIIFSLIALTLDGLSATLGAWIGTSLRRADRQTSRLDRPVARPARLLLLALALDLLVWTTTVEFNALGGAKRLLGVGDLGSSFISQPFGLWLLGFLVVLAFVLVSARPRRAAAAV